MEERKGSSAHALGAARPIAPELKERIQEALKAGPLKPGADSFLNDRSLELGKDAQHLEHGLAGGGGRIEPLLMQEQIDPERVEFGQEANQVLQAAAETIDVPSPDASRLN
jgi:hypothetical protein